MRASRAKRVQDSKSCTRNPSCVSMAHATSIPGTRLPLRRAPCRAPREHRRLSERLLAPHLPQCRGPSPERRGRDILFTGKDQSVAAANTWNVSSPTPSVVLESAFFQPEQIPIMMKHSRRGRGSSCIPGRCRRHRGRSGFQIGCEIRVTESFAGGLRISGPVVPIAVHAASPAGFSGSHTRRRDGKDRPCFTVATSSALARPSRWAPAPPARPSRPMQIQPPTSAAIATTCGPTAHRSQA